MRRTIAVALSMLVIATAPAAAQTQTNTPAQPAPAIQSTPVAVPAAAITAPAATKQGAAARFENTQNVVTAVDAPTTVRVRAVRHSVALMIVGAAGLLVGSIVGGDSGTIIMVGGGVIGLYGLYQYLR